MVSWTSFAEKMHTHHLSAADSARLLVCAISRSILKMFPKDTSPHILDESAPKGVALRFCSHPIHGGESHLPDTLALWSTSPPLLYYTIHRHKLLLVNQALAH